MTSHTATEEQCFYPAAYWDQGKIVETVVVRQICAELGGAMPYEFGIVPLYKGDGTRDAVGRECGKCGTPLGPVDPDDCKYIMLGVCSDCRE